MNKPLQQHAILTHFHALYLLNERSKRFNNTDFQSVSSSDLGDDKLSKAFASVIPSGCGAAVHFISSLLIRNFSVQFTISTKLITVEGVALNTSTHQYCFMPIAPPSEHGKSALYYLLDLLH